MTYDGSNYISVVHHTREDGDEGTPCKANAIFQGAVTQMPAAHGCWSCSATDSVRFNNLQTHEEGKIASCDRLCGEPHPKILHLLLELIDIINLDMLHLMG